MNPQIKQKWVSALRSGDYQQGQYCLRKEDKFCCLGVLCDLYIKENHLEWELVNNRNYYGFQYKVADLPPSVVEWSGIPSHNLMDISERTFANLNDTGSTFNEIADVIEEQL